MTRYLELDEGLTIEGAYDDRKNFTTDLKIAEGDTSKDAELARYLQEEEFNPVRTTSADLTPRADPTMLSNVMAPIYEANKLAQDYKKKYEGEHFNRLAAEERMRAEAQIAMLKNQERAREIDAFNKLALERSMYRYSDPTYDRLLRWSSTLFPDYWPSHRRNLIRDSIADLIKRELLLSRSEYELEDKIRKLIKDTEYQDKKKPAARRSRKPAPRKSRKSQKKPKARGHIPKKKN
jgi:hypothetical protein